jgi:hypothetical protein
MVQFISISITEAERTARLPFTGLAKLNTRAENLKSTRVSQTSRAEGAAPQCKNALIRAAHSLCNTEFVIIGHKSILEY